LDGIALGGHDISVPVDIRSCLSFHSLDALLISPLINVNGDGLRYIKDMMLVMTSHWSIIPVAFSFVLRDQALLGPR
jgi:hypothetical protein